MVNERDSGVKGTLRRLGIWLYVLISIFVIVVGYLLILHQEHLAAYSGIIFFIFFIALHLFMHASHGGHGGHGDTGGAHEEHEMKSAEAGTKKGESDEKA